MNDLIFLFFRRMRAPLLVLVGAYAISIGGLTLIPSVDPDGNPWQMSFFHAFYFVSFMGSTIGFGEIPYPFNDAQRMWTTVAMYLCVIAWLYAIGVILSLIQNPSFRRVVAAQRFTDQVKRLAEPFYLICGYGETGTLLVDALSERGLQSVVVDHSAERVDQLVLDDRRVDVPALHADAREVRHLTAAGLMHSRCLGTIALTSDEDINVKVAITSKLLRPSQLVICRANTKATAANLASFNTDHIINPFQVFAEYLGLALRAPHAHQLYSWLVAAPGTPLPRPARAPRGTWIICGFGRFGREVRRYLDYEGVNTVVIEPDPGQAPEDAVIGRGTEAVTLREAGIDKAVGLVAGADLDINNLSIVMTARALNPQLFVVARQNRRANDAVFAAAKPDLIMETSRILVMRILPLLTTPLLSRFLLQVRHRNDDWADALLGRLRAFCQRRTPRVWGVNLNKGQAPGLCQMLTIGRTISVGDIIGSTRGEPDAVVLMLRRGGKDKVLPDDDEPLQLGDRLLFVADSGGAARLEWALQNFNVLEYTLTGQMRPDGWLWRWLIRKGWLSDVSRDAASHEPS